MIQQKVRWHTVLTDESGQRLDNFLIAQLNKVPKSLVYRIIRKGEVRANKKRIKPDYKINSGDLIRIPPVKLSLKDAGFTVSKAGAGASIRSGHYF